jgi:hypothetical protein
MSRRSEGLGDDLKAASDAATISELRERLDQMLYTKVWSIKRTEIIALLDIVVESLTRLLVEIEYTPSLEIHKEHKAVGQLKKVILALRDLDRGIVHDALKPATNQANAALSSEQMELDNLLVEFVVVVQGKEGYETLHEAECHVAQVLRKAGLKRRGKAITPAMLRGLRNHPKKPRV